MNFIKEKFQNNQRIGIFLLAIFAFWAKTMFAYYTEFTLGVSGAMQLFILWINPFATSTIFLSLALYTKNKKKSLYTMLGIYFLMSVLLFINILYYREFADFMTLSTILTNISGDDSILSGGVLESFFVMLRPVDILFWIDFIGLTWLVRRLLKSEQIQVKEKKPFYKRYAFAGTIAGIAMLFGNLMIAEADRPQLLTRTFDRNYIVKYLGVNFFAGYDAAQTIQNSRVRAQADEGDLTEVYNFAKENHAVPDEKYFGIAEDKNVITLVVESVQQFVIDYELEDENGDLHEVSPFMNSIYHDDSTISFNNFFHQTGQGKSSDAEILAENSLYGLPEGSAFQVLGSDNTFHSTPKILSEEKGYTSAAFHGNTGTFWNRNDTYQNFGYDYFFDSNFYDMSEDRVLDYGLKDKLMFKDSVEYMEQLPQPFYSKFITLTNHFPYPLEEENATIPKANTDDQTVNQYFQTVRYTDEAIEEFFNWLKDSGLYEDSIVVIYGDHFGTSNMRNPHLAPLLGEDPEEWGAYENTQMQRVPLMFHIPGYSEGEVKETYGGQVDFLPTLLHLLGIDTNPYLFMGQDMLSEQNEQLVPLRNGNVLTPEHHFIGSNIYDADSGEDITETLSESEREELLEKAGHGRERLTNSDSLMNLDLLRFYQPVSLKDWEPNDYIYQEQMPHLKDDPGRETSVIGQNNGESTTDLYETDAPELPENQPVEMGEGESLNQDGGAKEPTPEENQPLEE